MLKRQEAIKPSEFRTFGNLLRYLRERAHLTQRELARRVGYHDSYLSRLEKNARTPDEFILRERFIPALKIEKGSDWAARLFELASESTVPAAPAAGSGWEPNLPSSFTPLLGRESESAALRQMLSCEGVRLVTLIGPPGVGKTRLALHVAEQLTLLFEDGALFVDLMPVLDAGQVLHALAAALGALEANDIRVFDKVKTVLRDREALIVMDNFEQVLEAAPQVAALLSAAPRLKILVTSREALRLNGEQEFPLAPLPVPDGKGRSALDFPSIQLFVQRARAAKPDLYLDEESMERVAELCRRLDGLPLAIELAAARIRVFSPVTMLEQFDQRFKWLAHTARSLPEWRRTLWSAIHWSYNLLNEKERLLFERLAVFSGGWTVEAAEAVCCDKTVPRAEVLPLLMQLADKSLVVAEAGARYRFLDTIGKFAHEKLAEHGSVEKIRLRHLRHFADWAESLEEQYDTITPRAFQERTSAELNNLRAAQEWALHHRETFADGARLSIPANLIFLEHGLIRHEYERSQVFLREMSDPALQARLFVRTASLALRLDHDDLAMEYCRKAEEIARKLGDRQTIAYALQITGEHDYQLARYDLAATTFRECVQFCRELNLPSRLSQNLARLASALFYQGHREAAQAAMSEAIQIAERNEDATSQAYALRALGGQLNHLGHFAGSFDAFKRALTLARASGDHASESVCLTNLSIQANLMEDYPVSETYALEAIAALQSIGSVQQAYTFRMLAYALLHQGLPSRAHEHAARSLSDNLNGGIGVLNCLTALAEIKLAIGDSKSAARLYGFVRAKLDSRYDTVSPDAQAYRRVGAALGKKSATWMKQGASMILEEAAKLASRPLGQPEEEPTGRPSANASAKNKRGRPQ